MARLEQTIDIDAPAQIVWRILSNFGEVADWAPSVSDSRLRGPASEGVGAERILRHVWGFSFVETVTAWSESSGFSFEVRDLPFPMSTARERWFLSATNNGTTSVTTKVEYETRVARLGEWFDRLFLHRVVRKTMCDGLKGLKQAAESVTA